jgi:hypothetical protein
MNRFTIVDESTGAVVTRIECSQRIAEQQVNHGQVLIAKWFDRNVRALRWAGNEWEPEVIGDAPVPTEVALCQALLQVDEAAGVARRRFITEVPGQQAVYMMKLAEARAVAADPGAAAPHIHSEAAATGCTAVEVAAAVIARADLWNAVLSPAIEAARIGGKAAVSAAALAGDAAAITAAAEAAIAQLDAIAPPA